MNKDENISFRVDKITKTQMESEAKRENRSLGNWIVNILKRFLAKPKGGV